MQGRKGEVAVNDYEVLCALRRQLEPEGAAGRMAKSLKVDQAYISRVRSGITPIPPRVAERLGFRKVTRWERIDEVVRKP